MPNSKYHVEPGQVYGRLTVLEVKPRLNRRINVSCLCICGVVKSIDYYHVVTGKTKSCGCLWAEGTHWTHGQSQHHNTNPVYRVWCAMKDRCFRKTDKFYSHYGGRGITICERWLNFANFMADMGPRPKGYSIERLANDGPYSPDNCVWADAKTQARNKASTRWITVNGQTLSMAEWAERLGVKSSTVSTRIDVLGWSEHDAVTLPKQHRWTRRGKGVKDSGRPVA